MVNYIYMQKGQLSELLAFAWDLIIVLRIQCVLFRVFLCMFMCKMIVTKELIASIYFEGG